MVGAWFSWCFGFSLVLFVVSLIFILYCWHCLWFGCTCMPDFCFVYWLFCLVFSVVTLILSFWDAFDYFWCLLVICCFVFGTCLLFLFNLFAFTLLLCGLLFGVLLFLCGWDYLWCLLFAWFWFASLPCDLGWCWLL